MMADIKPENNLVDDNGKVMITDNDIKHQDVGHKSTIDYVAQVLLEFCGKITMHGLGQVSYHTARIAKFVWIVAFLGAQARLFYHISNLIQLYIDRPIQETTTILHKPTRFPGVTVCNLDPISR